MNYNSKISMTSHTIRGVASRNVKGNCTSECFQEAVVVLLVYTRCAGSDSTSHKVAYSTIVRHLDKAVAQLSGSYKFAVLRADAFSSNYLSNQNTSQKNRKRKLCCKTKGFFVPRSN